MIFTSLGLCIERLPFCGSMRANASVKVAESLGAVRIRGDGARTAG
jgi:hypothetical protein